jgi:hypothetical protein
MDNKSLPLLAGFSFEEEFETHKNPLFLGLFR